MTFEYMIEAVVGYVEYSAEKKGRRKDGAGDRDRTGDIQLGKLAFYR
jgi:hypothetical protein